MRFYYIDVNFIRLTYFYLFNAVNEESKTSMCGARVKMWSELLLYLY